MSKFEERQRRQIEGAYWEDQLPREREQLAQLDRLADYLEQVAGWPDQPEVRATLTRLRDYIDHVEVTFGGTQTAEQAEPAPAGGPAGLHPEPVRDLPGAPGVRRLPDARAARKLVVRRVRLPEVQRRDLHGLAKSGDRKDPGRYERAHLPAGPPVDAGPAPATPPGPAAPAAAALDLTAYSAAELLQLLGRIQSEQENRYWEQAPIVGEPNALSYSYDRCDHCAKKTHVAIESDERGWPLSIQCAACAGTEPEEEAEAEEE